MDRRDGLRGLVPGVRSRMRLTYTAAQILLNIVKPPMSFDITLGLCLPRSCSPDDIASILTFSIMLNDNLKANKTVPRIIKLRSLREVTDHYDLGTDYGAIALISVTAFLFILAVIATVVEMKLIKCRSNSRSLSFNVQKFDTDKANAITVSKSKKQSENKDSVMNEKLEINNLNTENNISLVAVKNVGGNLAAPSITLDVVPLERAMGSCNRCGKYRRQCRIIKQLDNLPACPRVKYSSVASLTTEEKRTHFAKRLLLCFSLKYCWIRIFNTNIANKDLSIVHVFRIIATFWIIFVHVSVIVGYATVNSTDIRDTDNIYVILATGTLAFDMLFFVSGLFSSHHYFYLRNHYTVEELVSFGGICGQILQYVCFVTNRAVRLLPSYLYAIFLSSVIARVSRRTSPLVLPDGDHTNCNKYWWRNLLYVTTFYPRDEQCMQVSWYLSTESQLHVVGALVCAVGAGRRGRVLAALLVAALLAATAADITDAHNEHTHHMPGVYSAYWTIIERPWARVVPYFFGVVTGWLLHKLEGTLKISKRVWWWSWGAWCACAAASAALWAAGGGAAAALHATYPPLLLWPALLAATNYTAVSRRLLSSGALAALSRLSYGALLLHAPAARLLLLDTDTQLCSHSLCIMSYFTGSTVLTLLGALVLSLLVEMPFCSLLRRLSDCANA